MKFIDTDTHNFKGYNICEVILNAVIFKPLDYPRKRSKRK